MLYQKEFNNIFQETEDRSTEFQKFKIFKFSRKNGGNITKNLKRNQKHNPKIRGKKTPAFE